MAPDDIARSFPRIQEMFYFARKKMLQIERNKVKESVGIYNCQACRKIKNGNKRCSGCYLVFYCGRSCQAQDWAKHKDDCKKIQKEYKSVHISYDLEDDKPNENPHIPYSEEKMSAWLLQMNSIAKKSHFVVKV